MTTKKLYKNKKNCCGCEICAQSCPKHIITMEKDEEGFLYPQIKDETACIDCGKCQKVCPVRNSSEIHSSFLYAYAGWAKDYYQLLSSSSGAASAILSQKFIEDEGIVYGAAYSDDFKRVNYIRVDNLDDLLKIKTSKYAQAEKKETVLQIKDDLTNGKKVLFTGLPCDCAGINRLFGACDNLFVLSLICHGPTSSAVLEQFSTNLEYRYLSKLKAFSMRHKKEGQWKPYYIYAEFANGKRHVERFEDSYFNKAFLYLKRPSCNACVFKKDAYSADLLIGDYHAAEPGMSTYNESGVSSILVLTQKGKALVDSISDCFCLQSIKTENATHQPAIIKPSKKRIIRRQFSSHFIRKGLSDACRLKSIEILENHDRIIYKLRVAGSRMKTKLRRRLKG